MEIKIAIGEIRRGMGYPNEAELSDASILMELWQTITLYRSSLNRSPEAWEISRWPFTVDADTKERNMSISDFGEGIFAQSKDDSNPYFLQRTIDLVRPDQMSMYWSGPTNLSIGGTWWGKHVASAFAVFNEGSQWKISWMPKHMQSADYVLWYVPGPAIVPPLFDDNTLFPLEEQNWFIVADCVVNLMPHIADRDKGLDAKQQALVEVATKKMQQWAPIFETRKWDGPRRENTTHRKIFGQSRSGARGIGGGGGGFI